MIAALAIALIALAPVAADAPTGGTLDTMTTYRVAGTGDSILHAMLVDGSLQSNDRWIDAEQGRQAYIRGNVNRASSWEMWAQVVANSRRGSWLIFQDNGLQCTQAEWRTLIRDIVALTPNDRGILMVLPIQLDAGVPNADVAAKANIIVQELPAQPVFEFVRWNQAVIADPTRVYDGTHPSAAGIDWLAAEIDRQVGYRFP